MSIITISRGSYSSGKEIAVKVAERLGYDCVDREVFLEASEEYNLPEIKLVRAIHDAPSILERLGHSKERYTAKFEAAFLRHMKKDSVVYHGLAGQYFIQDVPHVLKIRIIADMGLRVRLEAERESISPKEARKLLEKDDEERRRWSAHLFGIDITDSSLYDVVYNIRAMTTDSVADAICHLIAQGQFNTSSWSQRVLEDLLTAAEVKLRLISYDPYISVTSRDGEITITTRSAASHQKAVQSELVATAMSIDGVTDVNVIFDAHARFV
jgi:cytidylate kinase